MTKARNLSKLASVNTSIVGNTVYISGNVSLANATLSFGANTINSTSLTSTGVVANSYGNTTAIPVITVDAAGRITNATTSSVSGVTGLSFAPANSTITVSTSTTNFDAVVTSGNSTVQGLLTVIDSVSNTSVLIAGSANSVTTAYLLAANAVSNATAAYSNAVSYANTIAGTAYSNAVSYANTIAGTAYSNATSYADTVASTAYSNAVSVAASDATSKAGTAYSNAIATAASDATSKAGTAYSNAISYANTAAGTAYSNAISYANTVAYTAAGTAYSNAISYANTVAYTAAGTAYSNVFNGGTFSGAVTVQANLTANSVRMNGDLQIDGNLTVSGNSVTINVTNLNVDDNMIYLNSNSTVSHPDLGFAGNYIDGSYKHAGLFRDATDGVWKFFHGYTPEPDASAFIDTANASFTFSNLQINYVIGNVTGSANSATYLGGNTASTLRTYSDTIAGTAYSNATTYAATIAGTAYSNAVSVAASDATTKAGTAYSNATTFATTAAGTAYSNATTYAATIAGTAYSNATAFAANASNISSGTLSASRLPATYLTSVTGTAPVVSSGGATPAISMAAANSTVAGYMTTTYASKLDGIASGATNVTNNNQLTNGAGYITGYTETDTLATVTGRGATTTTQISINAQTTINTTTPGLGTGYGLHFGGQTTNDYATGITFSAGSATATNANAGMYVQGSGSYGTKMYLATTDAYVSGAKTAITINPDGTVITNRNYLQASSSLRAPIFYDSDDTGYYTDPASTSRIRKTNLIASGSGWDDGLNLYSSDATNRWNFLVDNGAADVFRLAYNNSEALQISTDRNIRAIVDFRAPIFYDSNDTGYYVDPNNTGVALRIAGAIQGNHVNWTGEHNKIQWHSSHMYFQNMSDGIWIFRNSNGTEPILLYASGYGQASGSWRAPIFYDSNDTGYYCDPNGTSELSGLSNGTKARAGLNLHHYNRQANTSDTNYWVGSQGWATSHSWNSALTTLGSCFMDLWGSDRQHPQGNGYTHAQGLQILHYRDGGGGDANVSYGWQMVGAHDAVNRWWLRGKWGSTIRSWYEIVTYGINVGGNLYPSISYDSENTAYYVDANSSSRMNTINADILRSYSYLYLDNNYGHCIVGLYNASRYQGVFAMGDAYKLAADGTTTGNLYGMAWSHPNAGGAAGNLTDHGLLIINNGGFRCAISNSIVASANITAYSDERLKTNWRNMPENYVARLAQVKVGIYDRIDQDAVTQVGVSAQSFQKLLPQAILTAKDDMQTLSVSYGNAALASAVELAKEVVLLKETISSQEARIAKLEALINKLVG